MHNLSNTNNHFYNKIPHPATAPQNSTRAYFEVQGNTETGFNVKANEAGLGVMVQELNNAIAKNNVQRRTYYLPHEVYAPNLINIEKIEVVENTPSLQINNNQGVVKWVMTIVTLVLLLTGLVNIADEVLAFIF